jgi:hypothetical protein
MGEVDGDRVAVRGQGMRQSQDRVNHHGHERPIGKF